MLSDQENPVVNDENGHDIQTADEQMGPANEESQVAVDDELKGPQRQDRYGSVIIPRRICRERGLKSHHKLTFVDQIQNQIT